MLELVRFCCPCYFELQGRKRKNISKISSRSRDRWNSAIAMLPQTTRNQRKLTDELLNEFGEKWSSFAEVVAFCHLTCRCFDRFLLQRVD